MIVLLTDYGYQGPYIGQLKAKLHQGSPDAKIIDLIHDLPAFNITASASLIPALTNGFQEGTIFICVVDPGVGSTRKAVLLKADSNYYIGPDNGLFDKLISVSSDVKQWEIIWRPEKMSDSFHGRDLFAPVASLLFNKSLKFDTSLKEYSTENNLLRLDNNPQLIYFDNFGNGITSIGRKEVTKKTKLKLSEYMISYSRVFSEVPEGHCFWYYNSIDLVEIACNQSSAFQKFDLVIGQKIELL